MFLVYVCVRMCVAVPISVENIGMRKLKLKRIVSRLYNMYDVYPSDLWCTTSPDDNIMFVEMRTFFPLYLECCYTLFALTHVWIICHKNIQEYFGKIQ